MHYFMANAGRERNQRSEVWETREQLGVRLLQYIDGDVESLPGIGQWPGKWRGRYQK